VDTIRHMSPFDGMTICGATPETTEGTWAATNSFGFANCPDCVREEAKRRERITKSREYSVPKIEKLTSHYVRGMMTINEFMREVEQVYLLAVAQYGGEE